MTQEGVVQVLLGDVTQPNICQITGHAGAHGETTIWQVELVFELNTVAPQADLQPLHNGIWGNAKWNNNTSEWPKMDFEQCCITYDRLQKVFIFMKSFQFEMCLLDLSISSYC